MRVRLVCSENLQRLLSEVLLSRGIMADDMVPLALVERGMTLPEQGLAIVFEPSLPWAHLQGHTWQVCVEIVDENWEPFVYKEADLVGITAFTASANRAYEIAALYRQNGIPVVMGAFTHRSGRKRLCGSWTRLPWARRKPFGHASWKITR